MMALSPFRSPGWCSSKKYDETSPRNVRREGSHPEGCVVVIAETNTILRTGSSATSGPTS